MERKGIKKREGNIHSYNIYNRKKKVTYAVREQKKDIREWVGKQAYVTNGWRNYMEIRELERSGRGVKKKKLFFKWCDVLRM